MTLRRILGSFLLAILLLAPFGRMAGAEAMPHHSPTAMTGHCEGESEPQPVRDLPSAIDCLTACATIAPPASPRLSEPPMPAPAPPVALAIARFDGLNPGADPPPPRGS